VSIFILEIEIDTGFEATLNIVIRSLFYVSKKFVTTNFLTVTERGQDSC
jgi:hypothetical protein